MESVLTGLRSIVFGVTGYLQFTKAGYERASKTFEPLGRMDGKIAVVTGANSGIGYETALGLAYMGATVHMVCRNQERGDSAKQRIVEASSNNNVALDIVDMSCPAEIKAFADSITKKHKSIDVLVNNAGVLLNQRSETKDGIETTFATNTLGVYYLTKLLIPCIPQGGRVINVSSGGMYNVKLSSNDLEYKTRPYDGVLAYAQTKRAEVELAAKWAQLFPSIRFNSMHPGWAETPGLESSLPSFFSSLKSELRTAKQGADTIIWAVSSDAVLKTDNGSFLFDRRQVSPHLTFAMTAADPSEIETLISACEAYLK